MRAAFLLLWMGLHAALVAAQSSVPMPTLPPVSSATASPMRTYALRLKPGQDVRQQLTAFTTEHQIRAGAMVTCVGSLTQVTLRLANQENPTVYHGHFEIVSLVGTLSTNGSHLHLAVSDSTGRTIGGHLLDGNLVYTTAELVIGVLDNLDFRREPDPTFNYRELTIYPITPAAKRRKQ
ncbi:DNA-binding protein [Hymenobacter sp. BT186]|uniref:DNA-binding protein n=1 Tax=Hymenobacter telluris TaxID=2816474 RepID=A0A939J9M9_9BACT|nr:PPC domain-containing DNA-binding protein [Hymenobacter telluris]MBO0357221.1 DNA-binding protein [Hymenobacter telluris]MBW3373247.1 DNA-binding protein [Hymenobacter norwichensis]